MSTQIPLDISARGYKMLTVTINPYSMDELSTQVNQEEVLSFEEASSYLGITYKAFTKLIRFNVDIKTRYVSKKHYKGRRRYVITKKGLFVLANVKDSGKGLKKRPQVDFSKSKQQLAERAIEATQFPAELLNDPVIKLRMDQLKMESRITKLEQAVIEPIQKYLTTEQREFMNERVRALSNKMNAPYGMIWSQLHRYMDKSNIDSYKFKDYKPAMKWIKARIDAY